MSWGQTKDMGAYFKPVRAGAEVDGTAASTGDNTEVDGSWIDMQGFEGLEFIWSYTAALGSGETLDMIANVQDADDISGTGAADVSTDYLSALASTTIATGESGGSTETGAYSLGIDTTMCKRYVRVQWTPNLSASGTDTFKIVPLYVQTGAKYPPAHTTRTTLRA